MTPDDPDGIRFLGLSELTLKYLKGSLWLLYQVISLFSVESTVSNNDRSSTRPGSPANSISI